MVASDAEEKEKTGEAMVATPGPVQRPEGLAEVEEEPPKTPEPKRVYEAGTQVSCKASFDGQNHPAEVVDRRRGSCLASGSQSQCFSQTPNITTS